MGFVGAASAVNKDLQRMMAERLAQQELARRAKAEQDRLAFQQQELAQRGQQFDQRLGLDREEFGQRQAEFGQQQTEFTAGAPEREARVGYLRTQQQDLEQKPLYAEQARQADEANDTREHGFRLGEIAASGQQARQTAALRTAGPDGDQNVSTAFVDERQGRLADAVKNVMADISGWTAGAGSALAGIPGTPARNLKAKLDTIAANIAFSELQEMRNASKTGGALGQISERELALLSAVLGSLDPGQSPAQLTSQLQQVQASLDRWEQAKAASSMNRPGGVNIVGPGPQVTPPPSGQPVTIRSIRQVP